jgi:hypothetical protein
VCKLSYLKFKHCVGFLLFLDLGQQIADDLPVLLAELVLDTLDLLQSQLYCLHLPEMGRVGVERAEGVGTGEFGVVVGG